MTHTEFWARLEDALGGAYGRHWARNHALLDLGSRTVEQALTDGVPPKEVWAAVWKDLDLPDRER